MSVGMSADASIIKRYRPDPGMDFAKLSTAQYSRVISSQNCVLPAYEHRKWTFTHEAWRVILGS